ncbi:hypothetical protein MMC30_007916 [Trapelia coarctata]|nr:hypothetical protein [Trapelia coarctata]
MAKLIVIGASVASTFVKNPEWIIRGITRDPSKPSAQALVAQGIEIVKADLGDTDSLIAAFKGANAIFAVTDFWTHIDPANNAKAEQAGKTINEYAYDLEVRQGMNIADAAAATSTLQTLEKFVYSALSNAKKWSKGKYTWVYHFDSKAAVVEYVKEKYSQLDAKMSTLQVGEYATNWKKMPILGPQKQPDGSFLLVKPCDGDAPVPFVVTEKDTGSFVQALIQSPPGVNLLGYGSLIGWAEYMRLWTSILKVPGSFRQVPVEEYLEKSPSLLARELHEGYSYQAEFGWDGGDPNVVHPNDLDIAIPTTSIEEYIKGEDWSSIF